MAEKKMPEKDVGDELRKMYPANPMNRNAENTETPVQNVPDKHTEKVLEGEVIVRKKSLGRKFSEAFLGENLKNVKGYAVREILIPTIKNTIFDIFTGSLSMFFWGNAGQRRSGIGFNQNPSQTRAYYGGNTYTTGNSLYSATTTAPRLTASRSSRDIEEIVFIERGQAENILNHLYELLEEYGRVRVMDYYDSVGYSGDFVNADWGWTDLRGSEIRGVRGGFIITLPPVISLR